MRHLVGHRKLGRTTAHRWALFRNLMSSLVEHERIETTLNKARELKPLADRLITLGKSNTLAARQRAFSYLQSKEGVGKLFNTLAPRFQERHGGYTRLLKLGYRLGDSAPMALIEYLDREAQPTSPEKGNSKKKAEKKTAKKESKK